MSCQDVDHDNGRDDEIHEKEKRNSRHPKGALDAGHRDVVK